MLLLTEADLGAFVSAELLQHYIVREGVNLLNTTHRYLVLKFLFLAQLVYCYSNFADAEYQLFNTFGLFACRSAFSNGSVNNIRANKLWLINPNQRFLVKLTNKIKQRQMR